MNGRNYRTKRIILVAVIVLAAAALPLLLQAQDGLSLIWSNVSSGYSIGRSADYRVAGTGGEVDGGAALTGDNYQVTGGFWSGVEEPPPYLTPPPLPTPPPGEYQIYLPSAIR